MSQEKIMIEVVKFLRKKKMDPELIISHLLKKNIVIEADKGFKFFRLLDVKRNKYLLEKDFIKLNVLLSFGYAENFKKWKSLKKSTNI